MEFFKRVTRVRFMTHRRLSYMASAIVIGGSLIALFVRGPEFGIDFTGGIVVEAGFSQDADLERIRKALGAAGLAPGRHAAILCDNDPVGFAASFGIMRAGLAYVPLDFRNSLEDNTRILDFGDADALFFQARFADQARALRARLPRLGLMVCLDERLADFPSLEDWCGGASPAAPPLEVAAASTAWLQTGSGTSGDFRMAMMTHRGYHAFVGFQLHWLPDTQPVMLVAAPITHAGGGLAYHVLALGGKLVLLEKPDAGAILEAMRALRAAGSSAATAIRSAAPSCAGASTASAGSARPRSRHSGASFSSRRISARVAI